MQIRVLGPLEVLADDGSLERPRGTKQRLLLAGFLCRSPAAATADELVDLLWNARQPAHPPAALRTQISRLRAFLKEAGAPEGILRREPHGYRLVSASFEVDADAFHEIVREAVDAPDSRTRLAALDRALDLWRGEPYEDVPDHPWLLGRIRSLTEARDAARARRIDCLLALDRPSEALAWVEPLVQGDPLGERPRALKMAALHALGRSHEAMAEYQDFRRVLSEELGLSPSDALKSVAQKILRHDPRLGSGPPAAEPEIRQEARQEVRFCRASDGVRLAYATVGQGPPLVKAANWLNHVELDWKGPLWRRLFRELGASHTLVRYDERGSGLSDWEVDEMSLEAWVTDLESVVDACGLDRFPLLGISQGCAVSIEYAARHPDRVTGLILHGGYAAGWRMDPTFSPAEVARRDASIDIVRHGWGEDTAAYRQMFTQTFIPGGRPEEVEWFNELERRSTSPENAARFMEAFATLDVRHRLPQVSAPTLVLHSRNDQRIHYRHGMEIATGIPNARFVMIESPNHLLLEHEPAFDDWIAEARRFLSEELPA